MVYIMEGAFNNMITKLSILLPKVQQQPPIPMHGEEFTYQKVYQLWIINLPKLLIMKLRMLAYFG